jgi:hypothetical protein
MDKRLRPNEKTLREAEPKPGVSYQLFDAALRRNRAPYSGQGLPRCLRFTHPNDEAPRKTRGHIARRFVDALSEF